MGGLGRTLTTNPTRDGGRASESVVREKYNNLKRAVC